jgi:hypothetical protein
MRRTLQITLIIVAAIPLILGLLNLSGGAAAFVPPEAVSPSLDSQMRFYAVWFMLPFFVTIWIVRNLDVAGPIMLITFGTMALAGCARIAFGSAIWHARAADDCRHRY